MPRKRLLFLHTGGTLSMRPAGDPGPLAPSGFLESVLPYVRGIEELADIEDEHVCNLDSSDLDPRWWEALAGRVAARLDEFDGFVVLHGTDTMAWTASALSFLLRGLPRPVVLTGSQRPIAEVLTDARINLLHAAACATLDIPEVGLFFGEALYRGNRATKVSVEAYGAFLSPNFPPLVRVGLELKRVAPPLRPQGPFALQSGFESRVAVIVLVPGTGPEQLLAAARAGVRGVVLLGFGSGNLPQAGWPAAVRQAVEAGVAVVLGSQCLNGRIEPQRYQGGAEALSAGALSAGLLTREAAVTRMMFLLHRCRDLADFREAWPRALAGEC